MEVDDSATEPGTRVNRKFRARLYNHGQRMVRVPLVGIASGVGVIYALPWRDPNATCVTGF